MASYIVDYASSMVQQTMQARIVETTKQKFQGRVEYALQYGDKTSLIYLGDPSAPQPREVLIKVRSPQFWTRLLAGADLVRAYQPCFLLSR